MQICLNSRAKDVGLYLPPCASRCAILISLLFIIINMVKKAEKLVIYKLFWVHRYFLSLYPMHVQSLEIYLKIEFDFSNEIFIQWC